MSSSYHCCSFLLVSSFTLAPRLASSCCSFLQRWQLLQSCLQTLVDLEARLYVLPFDAVSWNMLQIWVTLGGEFEHSETGVDIGLKRRGMTRLLALSHFLSQSQTHVRLPFLEVSGALTARGVAIAATRALLKSPCLEGLE